jgi:hypothetical protein
MNTITILSKSVDIYTLGVEKTPQRGTSYNMIIIRMIMPRGLIWAGHVVRMEEGRSAFNILTGTTTGKRPFRTT